MIRHEYSERKRPNRDWPGWRYGPDGEGAIFNRQEDVPEGWTRRPGIPEPTFIRPTTKTLSRGDLIAQLTEHGIEVNPLWGNAHMQKVLNDISPAR